MGQTFEAIADCGTPGRRPLRPALLVCNRFAIAVVGGVAWLPHVGGWSGASGGAAAGAEGWL